METVCSQKTGLSMEVAFQIMFQGNMTISTNNATYGGAIQAIEARINFTGNCKFSKNLATLNGGALALAGGFLYLSQLFSILLKTLLILLEVQSTRTMFCTVFLT